ncbi:hypothetical protein ASF62_12325 [Leifsonia sp. Leaf325]|nr:SGNH/GDSL hydrolase family protein [Leifsonia sp. Leaf325]KQQ92625.1 hypothetical protein ASF62_12325 [Leifsonia sp. Leaf325]
MKHLTRSVAGAVGLLLAAALLSGCAPSAAQSMIDPAATPSAGSPAPLSEGAVPTPVPTPAPTADATGQRQVVAFYGDSFTHGQGASVSGKRWSTLVSDDHDWIEINPSISGLGFVKNRTRDAIDIVDTIVAAQPDIVISTMGLNDNSVMPGSAAEVHAAIEADFHRFATEIPDARFIVVEPFWSNQDRPASVDRIIGWVKAAATEVGADYISGASHWMDGHPELHEPSGGHPNDAGHAMIARRMDAALAKLGL